MAMLKKEPVWSMDGLVELTSEQNKTGAVWVIEESRCLTAVRKAGAGNGN